MAMCMSANNVFAYAETGEIHYEFESVPATSLELEISDNSIKPNEEISLGYKVIPWHTTSDIHFEIAENISYASISSTGKLKVSYDAQSHVGETFHVYAIANNGNSVLKSEAHSITIEKIPLNSFTIQSNKATVQQGGFATISVASTDPFDATMYGGIKYRIQDSTYASINEITGEISVSKNLPDNNCVISVYAECDGAVSNTLQIPLFIPEFKLTANSSKLPIEVLEGEKISLSISYGTDTVYSGDLQFEIISGAEFIVADSVEITSSTTGAITIKDNISFAGARIILQAICDGVVSNPITINIYLPVKNLNFDNSPSVIEQGVGNIPNTYKYLAKPVEEYATTAANPISYSLKTIDGKALSATVATIDSKTGILSIKENYASVGTQITVVATWSDVERNLIVTEEKIVTIARVKAESISLCVKKGANSVGNVIDNSLKPRPGDKLTISVDFMPCNTSLKDYNISVSEISGFSLTANSFNVNKTSIIVPSLSNISSDNPSFKITATYIDGGIQKTASTIIRIYVPVENIDMMLGSTPISVSNSSPTELDRNTDYSLAVRYNGVNNVSTEKGVTYSNISSGLTINDGKLRIDKSKTAGAVLSFTVISKSDTRISQIFYVKVAPLGGYFSINYYDYDVKQFTRQGTDSRKVPLNTEGNPDLEYDSEAKFELRYNGDLLSESSGYGLTYSVTAQNAGYAKSGSVVTISPNAYSGQIKYTISVIDGSYTYKLTNDGTSTVKKTIGSVITSIQNNMSMPKPINIFKQGINSVNLNTKYVYEKSNTISINTYSSNSPVSNLTLKLKDNDGGKVSFSSGNLNINNENVSESQVFYAEGKQYYNGNERIVKSGDIYVNLKTITFDFCGGTGNLKSIRAVNGYSGSIDIPYREGYLFKGYYTSSNGSGTQWYTGNGELVSGRVFNSSTPTKLYASWEFTQYTVIVSKYYGDAHHDETTYTMNHNSASFSVTASDVSGYSFGEWFKDGVSCSKSKDLTISYEADIKGGTTVRYAAHYAKDSNGSSCVVAGTNVRLPDGSQKPIEEICVGDEVLVFDFKSQTFVSTSVILNVGHGEGNYTAISLEFANGSTLTLADLHILFDVTQMQYVTVDSNNVYNFVGDNFLAIGENGSFEITELVNASVKTEYTVAYTLVTSYYYNCLTEDIVSATPVIPGIYELVSSYLDEDMKFNNDEFETDVALYGLYEYELFSEYLSYEQYEALCGPYFKLAVEKGFTTFEEVYSLMVMYSYIY